MLATRTALAAACLLALTLATAPASAQERHVTEPVYMTLDLNGGGAVNDPLNNQFGPGGDGALGLYFSLIPELAIGGQVMGGALSPGAIIPQDPVDRGVGDYGLVSASVRIYPFASLMGNRRAAGLYVGASPGLGLFDGKITPGYTASLGFNFAAGPITIGPTFRFTHFLETEGRFGNNNILMLTGGLEIAIMDEAQVVETPAPPPPAPEPEPVAVIVEEPLPPPEPEVNPAEEINDALATDERAYFDYDQAELRSDARPQLDRVIAHWREYGDRYHRLVISGYADDRGSNEYNEMLSAARAMAVANYLVSAGVPVAVLDVRAFGENDPIVPDAQTERDHQINRRVQFSVIWNDDQRPVGIAPPPNPNMPEYVDAAPARVQEHPRAWADARPAPGTVSHAERLLEQEEEALRERVGEPVTFALRDLPGETPEQGRQVAIEVPGAAVASR